ncbi:MAG: ATP-binding cassette domain-containing protein, partial [Pseudomonadota bacterium]
GEQIVEAIEANTDKRGSAARAYAIELLEQAEVPMPEDRLSKYPHQLSGGLCQRIVFAIAISAKPDLIIADEPTTALDVTTQAEILTLIARLKAAHGLSVLFITHDFGVVAEIADRVAVMKEGVQVETGPTDEVLARPRHAYTRKLIAAITPEARRPGTTAPAPILEARGLNLT